jgi:hypothetical protein
MSEIPKMLNKRPEMSASLLREKADLSIRLSQLALRRTLLETMLTETATEADTASDRIGAINDFLAEPDGTPAA